MDTTSAGIAYPDSWLTGHRKQGISRGDSVEVNRYERNQQNREQCIAEHGSSCKVCSMDFGSTYGAFAEGYIHVHHIVLLAQIEDHVNHIVDPAKDLVPVCPNCHAMLHLHPDKPCTVEKLRQLMAEAAQN